MKLDKFCSLVENELSSSSQWEYEDDGSEWPVHYRVVPEGVQVVGIDAGGRDETAFAWFYPGAISVEDTVDQATPYEGKTIRSEEGSGEDYDLQTEAAEYYYNEDPQGMWDFLMGIDGHDDALPRV